MVRRTRLLAVAVATALLATACGGDDDDTTSSDPPDASEAPAATDEDGGDDTASGDSASLTMGSWRSDDVEQMETLLAALHEAHPNITVSFEPTLNTEYNAALRTALETGNAPDLFYLRSYATGRRLFEEGFIAPLTDVGLDGVVQRGQPRPVDGLTGVPYGLPFIAVSHGIYYNADLFAEHGIEVPETWDDLLAAAETLDAAGITPIANATGDEWTMAEMMWMNFAPELHRRPRRTPRVRVGRAVPRRRGHRQRVPGDGRSGAIPARRPGSTHLHRQPTAVADREAAMWIGGSWDIPYFEGQEPAFEWSEFQVPTPEGGTKAVTFHLDAGIGINAATEQHGGRPRP